MERADELALDLLSEGITGMKIWPFDYVAHFPGGWDNWRSFRGMFDPTIRSLGGHDISAADIDAALEPFRKIRKAVGEQMEIMVEGHGLWSLPAALKIARALEEFRPAWLEDLMRADDIDALAELRRGTTTPDPGQRIPGDPLRVPAAAGEAGGGHRDDRPDLGRRHHRVQEDRDDGRGLQAAGRDARLHRAVHAVRRHPPGDQRHRTRSIRNRCGRTCG